MIKIFRNSASRNFIHPLRTSRDFSSINFTFEFDEQKKKVSATPGETILTVSQDNDLPIEGACGGELACGTCHVIVEEELHEQLPPIGEDEDKMLDLAQVRRSTSTTWLSD